MFKEDLYNQKMNKTFDIFVKELASLRTGRANASMLDLIKVDVYGQKMPINQLATITTPEPRVINIQVWDANNVTHILGVRAFGTQLLCEQVVGRGLRRMNYTPDPETGKLPPEYVDVYGIPFSIIPFKDLSFPAALS